MLNNLVQGTKLPL